MQLLVLLHFKPKNLAKTKKHCNLAPVFIGYGLKTGQGFYPGPTNLNSNFHTSISFLLKSVYKLIFSKLYPISEYNFKILGRVYFIRL